MKEKAGLLSHLSDNDLSGLAGNMYSSSVYLAVLYSVLTYLPKLKAPRDPWDDMEMRELWKLSEAVNDEM